MKEHGIDAMALIGKVEEITKNRFNIKRKSLRKLLRLQYTQHGKTGGIIVELIWRWDNAFSEYTMPELTGERFQ